MSAAVLAILSTHGHLTVGQLLAAVAIGAVLAGLLIWWTSR